MIYVLLFQLWRLVFLEPLGVQRHIVPHFKGLISGTHCEFRLRNGRGKTCLWKKYILVYLHRQKQGKKNFWLPTLSFWATSQTAPASQPIGLDFMVHVSPALKRTMYEFKNFSSPAFNCQSRPKYIFSRDMFCLYHFWAWIQGVICKKLLKEEANIFFSRSFWGNWIPIG